MTWVGGDGPKESLIWEISHFIIYLYLDTIVSIACVKLTDGKVILNKKLINSYRQKLLIKIEESPLASLHKPVQEMIR